MELPLDIRDIFKILPHQYPFLLVDRVLEINRVVNGNSTVGSTLKALKNVTFNEPFFPGHFPGNPIMPGVLIIEALAQAAAMSAARPKPTEEKWTFYILGVDKARFRKPVIPGDQLILDVKCIKDRGTTFVFETKASVGGQLATEAEILAKMV